MAMWSQLTGWMKRGPLNRRQPAPARRTVILRLERLEDRTVPSGGPGPTSISGVSGSSGGPAAVVTTAPATPPATFTINVSAVAQANGPTPLQVLIPAYPVLPATGPCLSGSMLVVNDPSVLAPLGSSTVALISVTTPSGGDSSNLTLTLVNTTTGAIVNVSVTVVPAPTSGPSGPSGTSGGSGAPATSGSTTPSVTGGSSSTSGSSGSTGSTTTTPGSPAPPAAI